jgi:phosphoribosyl-AMP cyclohydrolase
MEKQMSDEKDKIPVSKISDLKFNEKNGLIPVVVQDAESKDVLMVAYMNAESLRLTLEKGLCTYWSRSEQKLWLKGETSKHFQYVVKIFYDCDKDTLLVLVRQDGVACHTGNWSCFYRELNVNE